MATKQKSEPKSAGLTVIDPPVDQTSEIIETPEGALSQQQLTPAASLFIKEAIDRKPPPVKLPIIAIDHKSEVFVLPSGEVVTEVKGYPVYVYQTRRFYKKPPATGEKGKPPDCWSAEINTAPDPTSLERQSADCINCPHARFGSGRDGKSQACGVQTWIFLVNSAFGGNPPIAALIAPPSSIRPLFGNRFSDVGYFERARLRHQAFEIVWTVFGLKRAGEVHCVLEPRMGPALEDLTKVQALVDLRNSFREFMEEMRGQTASFATQEGE